MAVLATGIVLFALVLWKKEFARRIGDVLGRAVSALLRLIRRPAAEQWGEAAVRFRRQTIDLVSKRGIALTITTVVSHLALILVLAVGRPPRRRL